MRYHKVADETVRRLPIYLRRLMFLSEQKQKNISSRDLANLLGINPWQIRKDFSYSGGFGRRPGQSKRYIDFSPCYITAPRKVKVITIDIAMHLARLPYHMATSEAPRPKVGAS